jgi:hypothetical protein
MIAVETAARFLAACLTFGFGLFVASTSLGSIRTVPRLWTPALALLALLALALAAYGLVGFVRVVPW